MQMAQVLERFKVTLSLYVRENIQVSKFQHSKVLL